MLRDRPVTGRVFVQANTVLGYQFWDHVGVVANQLATRFQSVAYVPPGVVVCQFDGILEPDDIQEVLEFAARLAR